MTKRCRERRVKRIASLNRWQDSPYLQGESWDARLQHEAPQSDDRKGNSQRSSSQTQGRRSYENHQLLPQQRLVLPQRIERYERDHGSGGNRVSSDTREPRFTGLAEIMRLMLMLAQLHRRISAAEHGALVTKATINLWWDCQISYTLDPISQARMKASKRRRLLSFVNCPNFYRPDSTLIMTGALIASDPHFQAHANGFAACQNGLVPQARPQTIFQKIEYSLWVHGCCSHSSQASKSGNAKAVLKSSSLAHTTAQATHIDLIGNF